MDFSIVFEKIELFAVVAHQKQTVRAFNASASFGCMMDTSEIVHSAKQPFSLIFLGGILRPVFI